MTFLSLFYINIRCRSTSDGVAPPRFYSSPEWKKTSFIFQSFPSNDHLIGLKTQVLPLNVYASGPEVLDDVFVVLRWFESQPETQTGSFIYQSRGYSNHSQENTPSDPCDHLQSAGKHQPVMVKKLGCRRQRGGCELGGGIWGSR